MALFSKTILRIQARQLEQARLIDASRWEAVQDELQPGERPLDNSPASFMGINGVDWDGVCYLTDRALLGDVAAGMRPYRWRLAFEEVTAYQLRRYRLGVRSADRSHLLEVPATARSVRLLLDVLDRLEGVPVVPNDEPF